MSKVFLDTNIFVYASDHKDPAKRDVARQLLLSMKGTPHVGVVSTQVLQELYNVLTRKLQLPSKLARAEIVAVSRLETIVITQPLVMAAIDLESTASISFWDALIVTAAESAHCDELWSEDLQSGRSFGSLKIVNPFTASP